MTNYLRITIPVSRSEWAALAQLAKQEIRDPREQLRVILRQELQRRGLLEKEGDDEAA